MIAQKLDVINKDVIGAKIIDAYVENPYGVSYITIVITDGKKYNIFPACEDSQSAEWFDIEAAEDTH